MTEESYSLNDLADASGIEARTVRSYIERGLLPSAESRGRGASYSSDHLSRLQVIKSLRRARPNITLAEIRIVLQQLTPAQIRNYSKGVITAAVCASGNEPSPLLPDSAEHVKEEDEELRTTVDWNQLATKLTGMDRVLHFLRDASGVAARVPSSKVEAWQRIAVTPDVELCVRSGFDAVQLAAFREFADLLRHLLENANALAVKGDE